MGSKNNPENRGMITELRKYDGKQVKPVLFISGARRFIAGMFDDGNLAIDPVTKEPIPYKSL